MARSWSCRGSIPLAWTGYASLEAKIAPVNGTPLGVICALVPAAAWSQLPPAYCTQWDSEGGEPGQFSWPLGVAVDASGNVYVADNGNHRIQVFCYGQTAVQNTTWGRVKSMFR